MSTKSRSLFKSFFQLSFSINIWFPDCTSVHLCILSWCRSRDLHCISSLTSLHHETTSYKRLVERRLNRFLCFSSSADCLLKSSYLRHGRPRNSWSTTLSHWRHRVPDWHSPKMKRHWNLARKRFTARVVFGHLHDAWKFKTIIGVYPPHVLPRNHDPFVSRLKPNQRRQWCSSDEDGDASSVSVGTVVVSIVGVPPNLQLHTFNAT